MAAADVLKRVRDQATAEVDGAKPNGVAGWWRVEGVAGARDRTTVRKPRCSRFSILAECRAGQIESFNDKWVRKDKAWIIWLFGRQIVCVPGSTADDCFHEDWVEEGC